MAQVKPTRTMQNYNVWAASFSSHYYILAIPYGPWYHRGDLHDEVYVEAPNPLPPPRMMCEMNGGIWDEQTEFCQDMYSPIVLDLAGNGYDLTNPANGVLFDLDADGTPEQISWTRPDSDDAWLAIDRNGNGIIDDGSELFGNASPVSPEATAANGFEALKNLDQPRFGPSIVDGRIDERDAPYARLLVWRDTNHNGVSEPDELISASDAGVAEISQDYRLSKRRDRHGNEFRQKGTAFLVGPEGVRHERICVHGNTPRPGRGPRGSPAAAAPSSSGGRRHAADADRIQRELEVRDPVAEMVRRLKRDIMAATNRLDAMRSSP